MAKANATSEVKNELVKMLNQALQLEHAARIQYLAHAETLSGKCAEKLVERIKEIASDEQKHEEKFRGLIGGYLLSWLGSRHHLLRLDAVALFQRLGEAGFGADVGNQAPAGDERQLVLGGEVAHIEHGNVELGAGDAKRDGVAAHRDLRRHHLEHFVGNAAQLLDGDGGNVQLLGETLGQAVLPQAVDVEQTGAEPPAGVGLQVESSVQNLGGDPPLGEQELS